MKALKLGDGRGRIWQRVNRHKAKRAYELDKTVVLCPCNYTPFLQSSMQHTIAKQDDVTKSFDYHTHVAMSMMCNSSDGVYLNYFVSA